MYALEFEKRLTTNFINSLKDLKVIEEKMRRAKKIIDITRKEKEEFKTRKMEELENKLMFLTAVNKSFRYLDEYEEKQENREKEKKRKKIEEFKKEAERIKK